MEIDWITIGLGVYSGILTTVDVLYLFYQNRKKIEVTTHSSESLKFEALYGMLPIKNIIAKK